MANIGIKEIWTSIPKFVIPAQAGTQLSAAVRGGKMGPRLRGDDGLGCGDDDEVR